MTRRIHHMLRAALPLICVAAPSTALGQNVLDDLGRRLTYSAADGGHWARLSGAFELTAYRAEEPAPGLLFFDDSTFVAPALSLSADAGLGARLLAHVRARADRGFDPGAVPDGDVRLDEYYLQVDLLDALRGRVRIGKFATAFGDWVTRHRARDNPLISAPLIYDDMVTVTDGVVPADTAAFMARHDQPEDKDTWVPVIWGPSYTTGASVAFGVGDVDVLLEAKNAALSAEVAAWDEWRRDTDVTFTGRIGWQPRPEWRVGASYSEGPYLRGTAADALPVGSALDDFQQRTVGLDLSYEHHRLQIWAEAVSSSFDVPNVGSVDMSGAFVEARWKLLTRWWLAGRWNQSWFDSVAGEDWDRDLQRADIAVGFRHSAHVQAKLEYSYGDARGGNVNGNRVLAGQLVVWF